MVVLGIITYGSRADDLLAEDVVEEWEAESFQQVGNCAVIFSKFAVSFCLIWIMG